MLTFFTGRARRDCEGVARRDFLRVGSLALGGLSLSQMLQARAASAAAGAPFVKDKSVVLLYLSGGASHIETFDPKMSAPDGTRSLTGEVATRVPGVTFGGTFPRLAQHADKLAVVRSFTHNVGAHESAHVHVLSGGTDPEGKQRFGFSIGSAYARLRGMNHPETGMPTYTLLTEKEIDGQYLKEIERVQAGSWPGLLGPSYAPFEHQTGWDVKPASSDKPKKGAKSEANPLAASMKLNIPADVLDNRLELLSRIDTLNRRIDGSGVMEAIDKFNGQAVNLIRGAAAEAFQYQKESPRLIERYDTSSVKIGFKQFRPSTLGKQMLVARRLCEAGCGFVTVHSAGWDMHADGNNPGIVSGMGMLGRTLDQAVSTFLEDLADRGLSDKILLVITGDFGRTPKANARGGRDHWAKLGTLAFAGGGLRMGQVIGQSARGADVPAADPVSPANLLTTVMHALFDVGELRLRSEFPRNLTKLIEDGQPIAPLF